MQNYWPGWTYCYTDDAGVLLFRIDSLFHTGLQKLMEVPILLGTSERSMAMRKCFNRMGWQNLFLHWLIYIDNTTTNRSIWRANLKCKNCIVQVWENVIHVFSQHKPHEHVVTIALETLPSKDFFPLFVQLVIRRIMDASCSCSGFSTSISNWWSGWVSPADQNVHISTCKWNAQVKHCFLLFERSRSMHDFPGMSTQSVSSAECTCTCSCTSPQNTRT